MNLPSEFPIVQAPMAGGPSTPALTAAVANAGGYGFVAGGYLTSEALRAAIEATRALTSGPFGVNLFVPSARSDLVEVSAYAATIQPEADRLQVTLGEPRWDDDAFDAKLDLLESLPVHLVSFTFGCPSVSVVQRLHRAGTQVAVTVTSAREARLATEVGADLLAVQGTEAGGHQGSFANSTNSANSAEIAANYTPLLAALAEIREVSALPMIGTGGIMTGHGAATVLAAGAVAVQLGTAFLCAAEAGTSPTYRQALLTARYADTIVTRAFSGRYARGLANRFALEHDRHAPQAYPEVHHLTRPLRAAATAAGDADVPNLWAGLGWRQVTAEPAADIVTRIAAGARAG
ncbi:MAG: 2-nitropropane dioxygenase [Frankiales bacterium]|nr:2-nitropropane dioxygenase [Frankiales bacterium]